MITKHYIITLVISLQVGMNTLSVVTNQSTELMTADQSKVLKQRTPSFLVIKGGIPGKCIAGICSTNIFTFLPLPTYEAKAKGFVVTQ